MNYPAVLLPASQYKKIETNLEDCFISRTLPSKDFIHPNTNRIRSDFLISTENEFEVFDYSTNLMGSFTYEHNYIQLIGDNKKYFRAYWDFEEDVKLPLYGKDFSIDNEKGVFFLQIGSIHNSLKCPYSKNKNIEAKASAIIVHSPSRSNFWHFSIRWLDQFGNLISVHESQWKNTIISSFRAKLSELLLLSLPADPCPIDRSHYCNN